MLRRRSKIYISNYGHHTRHGVFLRYIPPEETSCKPIHFHVLHYFQCHANNIVYVRQWSGRCHGNSWWMQSLCGMSVKTNVTSPGFRKQCTHWSASCFELYPHSSPLTLKCELEGKLRWEDAILASYCYHVFTNVVSFANLITQVHVTSLYSSAAPSRL